MDEFSREDVPFKYSITSYGADYPVDALVKRMQTESIYIPPFQRQYIWTQRQASRFVESLLLGLPVPGVFFSKEADSNKHIVIDGQQRLKTLRMFYEGVFRQREFKLVEVQDAFDGLTYKTLSEEQRRELDDYLIHATIIKQDEPSDDQSSVFHVFERLNTGGAQLQAQEIRACIYFGEFNELLARLNALPAWRAVYGPVSSRMKDQELILRFFALYYAEQLYSRPMKAFLNSFMGEHRKLDIISGAEFTELFSETIGLISEEIGLSAFRPTRTFNAAVFDAIMVGLARCLKDSPFEKGAIRIVYRNLLNEPDFRKSYLKSTADEVQVKRRLSIATKAFAKIK